MKQTTVLFALILGVTPVTSDAQSLIFDLYGVSVTDRATGVLSTSAPGRGLGFGGGVAISLGALTIEAHSLKTTLDRELDSGAGPLGLDPATDSWDITRIDARARVRVLGPVAVEVSAVRMNLDPDINGAEMGFVSAGLFGQLELVPGANVWGRFAAIPYAKFSGSGDPGFAAEAHFGIYLPLTGGLALTARYEFQRIDRKISSGTSKLQSDVARIGLSFALGGGR